MIISHGNVSTRVHHGACLKNSLHSAKWEQIALSPVVIYFNSGRGGVIERVIPLLSISANRRAIPARKEHHLNTGFSVTSPWHLFKLLRANEATRITEKGGLPSYGASSRESWVELRKLRTSAYFPWRNHIFRGSRRYSGTRGRSANENEKERIAYR